MREAKLDALRQVSHVCPRRAGKYPCGGRLEVYTDHLGRTRVRCLLCERRKAGICRDCPAPVYGARGRALRCRVHADQAVRESLARYAERNIEEVRARARARYQNDPVKRAHGNALKSLWRKTNPDKVRAQKLRYVEKYRADPSSKYNRYHARYRAKYRLQKRELERDRLKAKPPARKTSPKCTRCGRSTRWRPVHKGHAGRPWTVCTKCLFPSERKIRRAARRREHQRSKAWEASIPNPARIRRPPKMAERGPGWERLCITPGCETVLTHRRKKCSKCREADRRAAELARAPFRGRGRRADLVRVA